MTTSTYYILRTMEPWLGYSAERFTLLVRLNTRWRDNQDPGIPARLKAILR